RTVLFVSHNLTAVKNLCNKGIVLEYGLKKLESDADTCITKYLSNNNVDGFSKTFDIYNGDYGNEQVRLLNVDVKVSSNKDFITINDSFDLNVNFETFREFDEFNLSVPIKSRIDESIILAQITKFKFLKKGVHTAILKIPSNFLNSGEFSFDIYFVNKAKSIFFVPNILNIEIEDDRTGLNYYGRWPGYIRPNLEFKIFSR
ncbi:MAG TPA: hypothetical protein DCQ50_12910, partial [Chryseobacterium sp.]|nr:hypothetical protein [Chryseobacterium sp.]